MDLLAQAAPIGDLAQYGALGIIAAALFIFAKHAYDREAARADRLEAELKRANAKIVDDVVPALERAAFLVETARTDRRGDRNVDTRPLPGER